MRAPKKKMTHKNRCGTKSEATATWNQLERQLAIQGGQVLHATSSPPSLHCQQTHLYLPQTSPAKLLFYNHFMNAVGNLIDMMMLSSSNSSSSGYENDAASAAAAAGEKKRRFSEAQVKSLEVMFEEQAKLEPRKKQQLAKELGLEPRQVAIWFQNKRARWKSKQLERAYAALSAEYDALRSSYDALLHQKNVLSMQVQRLAEMLETNNQQDKKESGETGSEADQTQILSLSSKTNVSDVKKKVNSVFVGKEVENHHHPHKTKEVGGGRVLVSEDNTEQKQFCFHGNGWASDQVMTGSGCSQWWEFLSYE